MIKSENKERNDDNKVIRYENEDFSISLLIPLSYIEEISEKIVIMNLKFHNNGYIMTSKVAIRSAIDDLLQNNDGEEILYIIIEHLKNEIYIKKNEYFEKNETCEKIEKISNIDILDNEKEPENLVYNNDNHANDYINEDKSMVINHSKILVEKKSQFLSHFSYVYSMDDVNNFKNTIFNDKKYSSATHNIFAYRFTCESTGICVYINAYVYIYTYVHDIHGYIYMYVIY